MRQTNIFQTHKYQHHIPKDVMLKALRLSPGKDWTKKTTKAYKFLKDWALEQDDIKDGKTN